MTVRPEKLGQVLLFRRVLQGCHPNLGEQTAGLSHTTVMHGQVDHGVAVAIDGLVCAEA